MTKAMSITFVVLIFEMILFGPIGIVVLGVSVRKSLIAMLLLMSMYQILVAGKVKSWQLGYLYGLAVFVAMWGAVVPLLNAVPTSLSAAEVTPLAGLCLILPFHHLFEKFGSRYYLSIVKMATFGLGVIVIVTWIVADLMGQISVGMAVRSAYIALNQTDVGIYIGPMADGSFRVMVIGCLMFPLVLAYYNWRRFSFGWSAFYLIAVYATGTRAFFLAAASIIAISLLRSRPLVAGLILLVMIAIFPLFFHHFEEKRMFEFAGELASDSARHVQFFSLMELFYDHPFFGAGFGASASVIRSEDAPYSYELTYIALLAKLGVIGAALALLPVAITIARALNRFPEYRTSLLSIVLAFILITATNPYLINSLGMATIAFSISLAKYCSTTLSADRGFARLQHFGGAVPT